jgi:NADPH-dependent ferric siderophore reductase
MAQKKRKARQLTVSASVALSKNMRRVTLHGHDLDSFPDNAEGAYFKLVFTGANPEQPVLRTYTVAKHRRQLQEIDVDFMLHHGSSGTQDGVAAAWALQAKVGDSMSIFGPGPATFINTEAQWFLLAADMTALPALLANITWLPPDAKGYLVIEIMDEDDKQAIDMPESMEVVWVINPLPGSDASPLYDAIKNVHWHDGQVAIWAACEFKTMRKIRSYFKQDKGVTKSHLYVSSYWKKGLQEEEHKVTKREDIDQFSKA